MLKFNSLDDVKFFDKPILGKGITASIYKIYHKQDWFWRPFAMKEMEKSNTKEIEYIQKEINIHSSLHH